MRKGGSMRMADLVPTMRVVTLDRPFSELWWMKVCRGWDDIVADRDAVSEYNKQVYIFKRR